MRSKRTNNVQRAIRLSYADRVLGAVVTIRRTQKKRAIHINTLRAQVRKTAELQQNPLGPQWSTWVGRAVTKLESQGILQEDCANRNICLTPRAKKALNDARRDLHTRTPSTVLQEEHLLKSINAQFLSPSTPFKRRRPSTHDIHDDSDHEPPMDTPTSRAKGARKRRKGVSGMSKAELQDELKRLRNVNEEAQAKLDAATRDAGRDAGDIERLKAELARREDEIERVRLELNDIRNQSSTLEYTTPQSDGYRSSGPPSSPTMHIGSMLRDNHRGTFPPFRKRTLPTSRIDDGNESDDLFDPSDIDLSTNSFSGSIQRHSTGTTTTSESSEISTTLIYGDPDDLDQACKTISALEQRVIEKAEIARRAELDRDSVGADIVSLRELVQSLETAIISEKLVTADLKDDLQTTSERRDALEIVANAKDQEIRRFEQVVGGLRQQIEEHVAFKRNLQDKISGLESILSETRMKLSITQEDASQLTTSLAMSQVTRVGLLAQIASLESSITQHQAEYTQELSNFRNTHALSLAEKRTRISELESSLTVAESNIAELQERLKTKTSSIEDERNALRVDLSSLQRSLQESNGAIRRLETSNESSRLALQGVTKELDGKRSELEALQARFVAGVQQSAALTNGLEEAKGRVQSAENEIATLRAAKKADEEVIRRATISRNKLRSFYVEYLAEMDGLVGII